MLVSGDTVVVVVSVPFVFDGLLPQAVSAEAITNAQNSFFMC